MRYRSSAHAARSRMRQRPEQNGRHGLPSQSTSRRLAAGDVHTVILLTGVGTRALAAAVADSCPDFPRVLERSTIIARGPKPLAALRELGVGGAHPVPAPHTWREVLGVVDALGAAAGRDVAVQEYGVPNRALLEALGARGARVLAVPVYRWALPEDTTPLRAGAAALVRGDADGDAMIRAVRGGAWSSTGGGAKGRRSCSPRATRGTCSPACPTSAPASSSPRRRTTWRKPTSANASTWKRMFGARSRSSAS